MRLREKHLPEHSDQRRYEGKGDQNHPADDMASDGTSFRIGCGEALKQELTDLRKEDGRYRQLNKSLPVIRLDREI